MTKPESPNGWGFNPAVVTLTLVVVGMIGGLISMAAVGGYYLGKLDTERQMQEQRINILQDVAERARDKAIYATKEADIKSGHANPPEKPKKTAEIKE